VVSPSAAEATATATAATVINNIHIAATSAVATATGPTPVLFTGLANQQNAPAATATATGPTPVVYIFEPELQEPVCGHIGKARTGRSNRYGQGRIVRPEEGALV
jgi:hypothetical protein